MITQYKPPQEQIKAHVITQYEPPQELVKFETSDELSDDIRVKVGYEFISNNDFVKTPKFKSFVYEYKGKKIR